VKAWIRRLLGIKTSTEIIMEMDMGKVMADAMDRAWRGTKEISPPKHVCGKQGFGIGPDGWKDICLACEDDKKERGF